MRRILATAAILLAVIGAAVLGTAIHSSLADDSGNTGITVVIPPGGEMGINCDADSLTFSQTDDSTGSFDCETTTTVPDTTTTP